MEKTLKHKLYMGFRGLMLRVPPFFSEKGSKRGAKGAQANAERLTDEERRVHHHIVLKMVNAREPYTAEILADELEMGNDRMEEIVDKLENLKTFIFRSDGKRIDWAYPLSLENTGFQMSASSGEQFYAAWAADAFASPYVLGKLLKRKLDFEVKAKCANSGRTIDIALDSDLNISRVTPGAKPMFCFPIVQLATTESPSIVDIFWRKSLLFWSEEDVREFKSKARDLRVYANLSKKSLAGIKRMQASIFGFDE